MKKLVLQNCGLFIRTARFHNGPMKTEDNQNSPDWLQVMWSTLAAFFGVQSRGNRERDFKKGKASHFIIMGLLMTFVFIGVVLLAVKIALAVAAGG